MILATIGSPVSTVRSIEPFRSWIAVIRPGKVLRALLSAGLRLTMIDSGGTDAVNLRVAEQYIKQFGNLAKEGNTLIIPSNLSEVGGMVAAATSLIKKV